MTRSTRLPVMLAEETRRTAMCSPATGRWSTTRHSLALQVPAWDVARRSLALQVCWRTRTIRIKTRHNNRLVPTECRDTAETVFGTSRRCITSRRFLWIWNADLRRRMGLAHCGHSGASAVFCSSRASMRLDISRSLKPPVSSNAWPCASFRRFSMYRTTAAIALPWRTSGGCRR